MPYFGDSIRIHAFRTIHDYTEYDQFEDEMIAYGEQLPPVDSPTAKDPHHRGTCRSAARWAWERKATIVPYDDFLDGKRIGE